MRTRPTALLGLVVLPAMLPGCTGPGDAERPAAAGLPVPTAIGAVATLAPVPDALPLDAVLRDPRLLRLVALALENNRDLRVAAANAEAARAGYGAARAQRRVSLDATAAAAVGLVSTEVPDRYAVGLVPRFALDLSGRVRQLSEAAFERYLSSREARRGVRLSLISAIATAYVDLATDRTLAALARDSQANGRLALEITRARLEGGIASEIDVRQAATILDQAEADEQNQRTLAAQDRNALELLVGAPVEDALLPAGVEGLEGRIAALPDGVSASVLLRRPDVAEA
jgi:multidrug efflux system outer membrane protein